MNYESFEEKIKNSSQRLLESAVVPGNLLYEPAGVEHLRLKRKRMTKVIAAIACFALVCFVSVSAFTGDLLFIPGLGSFFKDSSNTITHSFGNIIEIEKDGYTHKVLSAYIMNERVYLEMFYYKTDVGLTFNRQYVSPLDSAASPVDYWIYYNGKKCGDYSKSYGSSISLSYKMPAVKKGEVMEVALYSGNEFISEIVLFPTDNCSVFSEEKPYAAVSDIIVTADVQTQGEQVQVFIGAVLPKDANRNDSLVHQCRAGFSEDNIYIQDAEGTVYRDKSVDSLDEGIYLHRLYHFFYFDIPSDVSNFTIIIPQITYNSEENGFVEKYGPWEIGIIR